MPPPKARQRASVKPGAIKFEFPINVQASPNMAAKTAAESAALSTAVAPDSTGTVKAAYGVSP